MPQQFPTPPHTINYGKPPKRKRFGFLAASLFTIGGLVVGGMIGSASAGGGSTTASPAAPATAAAPSKTAKPKQPAKPVASPAPVAEIGDGVHKVGTDIKPGRYVTTVPEDAFGCYWARLKNDSGEMSAVITNGNLAAKAKGSLTVKASDKFVELSGGCTWKQA